MAVLGFIIKNALELHEMITGSDDHVSNQLDVLKNILKAAQETSFGQFYGFKDILTQDDIISAYAAEVPYFDYHHMAERWWSAVHAGKSDITWPGKPNYLARSSGTTGKKSKMIPVSAAMIDAIRFAGAQQLNALPNFNLPDDLFEKEVLALGSSTDLDEYNGFEVGEISGISASKIPGWLDNWYKPGPKIAAIDDWDERVHKIAEKAKEWDIGTISGIPSWIELMLQKVIAHHQVKHIHEIWPNLGVYMTGGVAFAPYERSFNKLLGKPIAIVDTYLASEGFIASQQRPDTAAMQLITNGGIYFEFVPMDDNYILEDGSLDQSAPVLSISEVKPNVDYILLITTVSGAYRYLIGDTIMFTDVDRAEIKITGRTKFFMNVVGSQLSVMKMEDAIKELQDKYEISIKEFTMSAKKINGEFHHVWYLGTDTDVSNDDLRDALDESLQKANKNYKVARSKALKGVEVHTIPADLFYDWSAEQKKKGGQIKMASVMKAEKFNEWEAFCEENS